MIINRIKKVPAELIMLMLVFLISICCVTIIYHKPFLTETIFAGLLSFIIYQVNARIKRKGLGKELSRFFFISVFLNMITTSFFLLLIFLTLHYLNFSIYPFILSIFIAYTIFMFYDVIKLHQQSIWSVYEK